MTRESGAGRNETPLTPRRAPPGGGFSTGRAAPDPNAAPKAAVAVTGRRGPRGSRVARFTPPPPRRQW